MTVRILTGNCLDLLREIPAESVDCIVADPPYGETSLTWDRVVSGWATEVHRVLKRTGSMWVFGTLRHLMGLSDELDGWRLAQDVIWEKHNGTGLFNDRFRRVHEQVAHFYRADAAWAGVYKKPLFTNDARARVVRKKGRPAQWIGATGETIYRSEDGGPRLMRSVMFCRSMHGKAEHPTQKPVELIEPLIEYSCPPGGLVLDPFCGSGSTGIAAKRNGCCFIGIEVNPAYATLAEDRIRDDAPLFAQAEAQP